MACWTRYCWLLEREYSDPAFLAVHRLTVDAYAAQHPGKPERRSIQSVNVHLVGLHLVLDRNLSGAFARKILGVITQQLVESLVWLEPPPSRGAVTVLQTLEAANAEEHGRLVRDWAMSVWSAWAPHRAATMKLADRAISLI